MLVSGSDVSDPYINGFLPNIISLFRYNVLRSGANPACWRVAGGRGGRNAMKSDEPPGKVLD